MDWTTRINSTLDALGLFPDIAAHAISDLAGYLVLVENQGVTVYRDAERCSHALQGVKRADDGHETWARVGEALAPYRVDDIQVVAYRSTQMRASGGTNPLR